MDADIHIYIWTRKNQLWTRSCLIFNEGRTYSISSLIQRKEIEKTMHGTTLIFFFPKIACLFIVIDLRGNLVILHEEKTKKEEEEG